jgi:hypothetical protein
MAKKPSSQIELIQSKIEFAQETVSKLTDESLRVIAFQTVLQRLLMSDEIIRTGSDQKAEESKPNKPELKHKAKQPKGPKGRVEELIEEGFFGKKRTIGEVKAGMEAHGWFHRVQELNPALLRLIKEKRLRRIKEPENEGGKLVWRYSNW